MPVEHQQNIKHKSHLHEWQGAVVIAGWEDRGFESLPGND
jgi:hypothetical protein